MNDNEKVSRAELARQIKDNPLYREAFTAVRAAMVESLGKIKKGRGYEEDLKRVHDTLQNLDRVESVIDRYFDDGKVVQHKRSRLSRAIG